MRYLCCCLYLLTALAGAQNVAPATVIPDPGQVLVTGTVPTEADKASILARLRTLYGTDKVVDQIAVGPVVLPANWNDHVQKLINPSLKLVRRGELKIDGNAVNIRGEVSNEAQRQQIASEIATNLNPAYRVTNGLRVTATGQNILDSTLGNRIIEFESAQTELTATGKTILDEIATTLQKMKGQKVEIIGHTDGTGLRASNIALSQARADAVKAYLGTKAIDPITLSTSGQGPDRPVASNDTTEGRARNRRIEFRLMQ